MFPSREYESLDAIVRKFVSMHNPSVEHACFGVAGPVRAGRSETLNLAWVIYASNLAAELGLSTVDLINDLEASAYGVALLMPEDFVVLSEGEPDAGGNAALISAGTGLGQAGLRRDGSYYLPFPSEGGHADFAPRNELETKLFLYLLSKYDHVSYERVLSGPGLYNIYEFLRDTVRGDQTTLIDEQMRLESPSLVITKAALDESCELCVRALDIFVSIYGAEAGNLALRFMATAGVFLGGGIAPKIITKLKEATFMKSFAAKGRMEKLLEAVPVRVIMNDGAALLGAARYAALRMGGGKG